MQVASLVGADPKEIIFTSGATESNNMAIKGVAGFYRDKKKHLITTQTERAPPQRALCQKSLSRPVTGPGDMLHGRPLHACRVQRQAAAARQAQCASGVQAPSKAESLQC